MWRRLPIAFLSLILLSGCGVDRRDTTGDTRPPGGAPTSGDDVEWFSDLAVETGFDVVHFNGMSGEFYDAEIFGPGVGLLDYDNDGDLDLYVVQGDMLSRGRSVDQARVRPRGPLAFRDRLYRNDLKVQPDGTRLLQFTDVTGGAGIVTRGYGMGVATGDIDNDGWVDLYLTRLGPDQMFRNNGDGTFTDVSKRSGTDDPGWSVSASFLDFDRDGWLDLYVGNYLRYSIDGDVDCSGLSGEPDYCPPASYPAEPDRLYRNTGDARFVDVTDSALLGGQYGPALGVVAADFNGDGWSDIYVANDGQENLLWMNQRNGTFKNAGLISGSALSGVGRAEASMGVDAGDFDNDGDDDLFMTHLTNEGHNLYVNDGSATFEDRSTPSGLGIPSFAYTGFGAGWLDFDNDGWLDVMTVNGAVRTIEALARQKDPFPFHQRPQLFRNTRNARFEEVSDRAGRVFQTSTIGRGAAFGDVDNDGDVDVLVGVNNGRAKLLVNAIGNRNHWLGVRLVGSRTPRDMVGARVAIVRPDGHTYWRRARSDGSYASASDPRVLVGLGVSPDVSRVRVVWPRGHTEEWTGVPVDQWTTLKEGTGR